MLRWNRRLSLTTVTGLEEAVERHYAESLFLAAALPQGPLTIADIGSGPGFPGIPVAVFRPDCTVYAIESHQRKAVFLREASRDLPNVKVVAQRAEAVGMQVDRAISRAISYSDLVPVLKLANAASLLTGAEAPPDEMGFAWDPPASLPWGRQRYLRTGRRTRFT